jgi:hypothetical protein
VQEYQEEGVANVDISYQDNSGTVALIGRHKVRRPEASGITSRRPPQAAPPPPPGTPAPQPTTSRATWRLPRTHAPLPCPSPSSPPPQARAAASIFSLLEDACAMPRGSDAALYDNLRGGLAGQPAVSFPPRLQGQFVLQHYAGAVAYNTDGFLEKNKDTLNNGGRPPACLPLAGPEGGICSAPGVVGHPGWWAAARRPCSRSRRRPGGLGELGPAASCACKSASGLRPPAHRMQARAFLPLSPPPPPPPPTPHTPTPLTSSPILPLCPTLLQTWWS